MEAETDGIRIAAGLAYVCGHLAELRDDLHDDGSDAASPLRRLVTAMQSDPFDPVGVAGLVETLHIAVVRATGDPWGIIGHANRHGTVAGVAQIEIVYRCPLGRCAGRLRDEVTGPARCAISGRELLRERLS
jgi:hypothetical protein